MSIPKIRPTPSPRRATHYFDPEPPSASKPHPVFLHLPGLDLELLADRGVFGSRGIDLGTLTLLKEAPEPPERGEILDLGCGYGPIALAIARRAPAARVWAVDVNQRALELTRANAESAETPNVKAVEPDGVPHEVKFSAIYSNPPVRIGKGPMHELLERWLPRLEPGGAAYLVVQRNLGADSLAKWLGDRGYDVQRLKSKKGYRVLEVRLASA
jgi:16S rRNA (guanine1207-N2)-methyltransferase